MAVSVFIARRIDASLFSNVHEDVFDAPPQPRLVESFLAAAHLHIAVAADADQMIGMCSGVVYHHPDKPDRYWINALRVAAPWRRQGVATRLIDVTFGHARRLGCTEVWGMADPTPEAMGFCRTLGVPQTAEGLAVYTFDLTR